MINLAPRTTFRGLPLTAEQACAEVRHDIKVQTQRDVS